jgi:hypothetical protein
LDWDIHGLLSIHESIVSGIFRDSGDNNGPIDIFSLNHTWLAGKSIIYK